MPRTKEQQNGAPSNQATVDNTLLLELPYAPMQEIGWGLRFDTRLTPLQSNGARRLAAALDLQQAKLADGTRVTEPLHAIRYVLEQVAGAE